MTVVDVDSDWTISTYAAHNEAMRLVEGQFQDERDRRYTEVNIEKEKALKIKETADRDAMSLARDAQTYKEKQNDALRDRSLEFGGTYATNASVSAAIEKLQASLQPLVDYVSSQKGSDKGSQSTIGNIYSAILVAAAIGGILFGIFK